MLIFKITSVDWECRWAEPQLFQSWNLKQSLAIFQTGWSLLGEAWAVKRKFWLKKRCLFPSNLTIPPVTTSSVVWPWVACSVNEERVDWCWITTPSEANITCVIYRGTDIFTLQLWQFYDPTAATLQLPFETNTVFTFIYIWESPMKVLHLSY